MKRVENSSSSMDIFFCYTPLHCLIANKIIDHLSLDDYYFIYISKSNNEKHRHYYSICEKGSSFSRFITLTNSTFENLSKLLSLGKELRAHNSSIDTLYSGNIKRVHGKFLMAFLTNIDSYRTFDDGVGNIFGSGYFYEKDPMSLAVLALGIFRRDLLYSNLLKIIERHYSIFMHPNAFPNTKFLPLFSRMNGIHEYEGEISILLSAPLSEYGLLSKTEEHELLRDVIENNWGITHVLPHPADKIVKFDGLGIKIIETNKIAEEVIYEISTQRRTKVFGFSSTALLNLATIGGAEIINISSHAVPTNEDFKLLLKDFGIQTYNL